MSMRNKSSSEEIAAETDGRGRRNDGLRCCEQRDEGGLRHVDRRRRLSDRGSELARHRLSSARSTRRAHYACKIDFEPFHNAQISFKLSHLHLTTSSDFRPE